ncbi:hypothetical protein Bca52824_047216 [Brassica carinata]|uniref:UPF0113 domain-containing protein n=1 Tax=Brassica carinata TaxID=52824 RepID=A0A8X7UR15_BRACI|nr:hypothetical protein Bca52824_047216 [Brassica carinata]
MSLNLLGANMKHKVWLKLTSEMSVLYGNHWLKGGLGRITDSIVPGDGVVVFYSTQDCRKLDPNGIVVLHQADIEDYLSFERLCLGNVGSFSACCFKLCLRFKICSLWNWVLDL